MSDGLTDKRGGNDESERLVPRMPKKLLASENPEYKRIADLIQEGVMARRNNTGPNPYGGQSVEHMLHSTGWVQEDLRLGLAERDPEGYGKTQAGRGPEYEEKWPMNIVINVTGKVDDEMKGRITMGIQDALRNNADRTDRMRKRTRPEDSYGQPRAPAEDMESAHVEPINTKGTSRTRPGALVEQGDVAKLTPAERELIEMLAEECGEVIVECTKILRHGLDSYNPTLPPEKRVLNRTALRRELNDVEAVKQMLIAADTIPAVSLAKIMQAISKKYRYTHHQVDPTLQFPTDWLNDR